MAPAKTTPTTSPKGVQASRLSAADKPQTRAYVFRYKGKTYDCTEYSEKHPGGKLFFDHFIDQKDDITDYFDALHSKQALQTLKAQPEVSPKSPADAVYKPSKHNLVYEEMRRLVEPLYEPKWAYEIALTAFCVICFLWGSFTTRWYLAIPLLFAGQIKMSWLGHSWCHSRHPILYKLGHTVPAVIAGYSARWWSTKHNRHHMFTNVMGRDDDIDHNYNKLLFMFLIIKWKYDSIAAEIKSTNLILLAVHWYIALHQQLWVILVTYLITGHILAVILVGNHEREQIFEDKCELDFVPHQITASRNYYQQSFLWLMFFGGMQFQTEHHFFPQIPHYRLPEAVKTIGQVLKKHDYKITYGSVM